VGLQSTHISCSLKVVAVEVIPKQNVACAITVKVR